MNVNPSISITSKSTVLKTKYVHDSTSKNLLHDIIIKSHLCAVLVIIKAHGPAI